MRVYDKKGRFISRAERAKIKARNQDILQGVMIALVFTIFVILLYKLT